MRWNLVLLYSLFMTRFNFPVETVCCQKIRLERGKSLNFHSFLQLFIIQNLKEMNLNPKTPPYLQFWINSSGPWSNFNFIFFITKYFNGKKNIWKDLLKHIKWSYSIDVVKDKVRCNLFRIYKIKTIQRRSFIINNSNKVFCLWLKTQLLWRRERGCVYLRDRMDTYCEIKFSSKRSQKENLVCDENAGDDVMGCHEALFGRSFESGGKFGGIRLSTVDDPGQELQHTAGL